MSAASTTIGTAAGPAGTRRERWHRALRAARIDLSLNADLFSGTMILAVLALLLAVVWTSVLTSLAPLWAALAWQRYGRARSTEGDLLTAGLGVSRAEAIRGRSLLVGFESAVLLVVFVLGDAVSEVLGGDHDGPAIPAMGTDHLGAVGSVLTTGLAAALTVTLVGLIVGRECTTRRPGWGMFVLSIAVFFGASLLVAGVVLVPIALVQHRIDAGWATWVSLVLLAAVVAAVVALLRQRIEVWIRALDSRRADGP